MQRNVFLIHWNALEAEAHADRLRSAGWQVEVESEDGARAARRLRESLPDVVVIYLTRLPSHGRETASHLRSLKATRDLPIVFVDGNEKAVQRTKARVPEAAFVSSVELTATLRELVGRSQSR